MRKKFMSAALLVIAAAVLAGCVSGREPHKSEAPVRTVPAQSAPVNTATPNVIIVTGTP